MAAGIPVLSTDVGGIKEILIGEDCGRVFPVNDIKSGAELLIQFLESYDFRASLGNNGKKTIAKKYNSTSFKVFFENLYCEILDN